MFVFVRFMLLSGMKISHEPLDMFYRNLQKVIIGYTSKIGNPLQSVQFKMADTANLNDKTQTGL